MIITLAALALAAEGLMPPGLLFGYYRMLAFETRSKASGCDTRDLDRELDALRDQLAKRFGRKPFHPPRQQTLPGDCWTIANVYRVNLADFRRTAEAALNASAISPVPSSNPRTDKE